MLSRIRPLLMLVTLFALSPVIVRADDWAEPRPVVYASQSGWHGFKVLPIKSSETASGVLFSLDADGQDKVVWKSRLVNVPAHVFVHEQGKHVVTVDTYAALGYKHALVIYDDKGKVVADYKLEELVSAEDIRDRISSSVSSRWWADQASFKFESGGHEFFKITTKWGAIIDADLTSGAVTKSGLTLSLVLSEELYDPVVPGKGSLKCVLRNETSRSIRIPSGYDVDTVRLECGPHVWLNRLIEDQDAKSPENRRDAVTMVHVSPNEERVLFELPLDDILAKGVTSRGDKKRKWSWD